jgi:hypothetical protein
MVSREKMSGFEEACSEEEGLSGNYHKNLGRLSLFTRLSKNFKSDFFIETTILLSANNL